MLYKLKAGLNKLLPKGRFVRGVGVLAGGTAGAQALMIMAAPVLTRLYSPADFGLLAAFTSLLALFSVVASGRYELAIPLPESDRDAAHIVVLCLIIVLGVCLTSAVFFLLFSSSIAILLKTPALENYLWIVPIGVLCIGFYQIFEKWGVRTKSFFEIARTKIFQTIGTLCIQLGAYKLGILALISGQALGQGLGATGLGISALKRKEFRSFEWAEVKRQAVKYKDLPIYSTWRALFNTVSLQLAPFLLIALYTPVVAGFYALTLRILSLPISLIGNAIANVFLSHAPEVHRRGNLHILVKQLHAKLATIGVPPLFFLLVASPDLFVLAFGEEWRKAGIYAQWMAPWIYIQFQWTPLSMLEVILDLQREALFLQLIMLVIRFGGLLVCFFLDFGADIAVLFFSIASVFAYILQQLFFFKKAGVQSFYVLFFVLKKMSLFLFFCIPSIIFLLVLDNFFVAFGLFLATSFFWLIKYSK